MLIDEVIYKKIIVTTRRDNNNNNNKYRNLQLQTHFHKIMSHHFN